MKSIATLALAVSTTALLVSSAASQADTGSAKSYEFNQAPTNSMGVKSLAELRGKPVLVEFWGTR